MGSTLLQYLFITGVLCFLGIIVSFLRKNALSLKYTLLWLFSAFIMLIVSIFPNILTPFKNVLGFEVVSNAVFSLLLGFVIIILLSITSICSKQTRKIKTLVQVIALLEKRVRELEDKNE